MSLALTKALLKQSTQRAVGSGILSGLKVLPQETPDMSVRVIAGASRSGSGQPLVYSEDDVAGIVYTDQMRFLYVKPALNLDIDPADPVDPRTDLIYVDRDGVIQVGKGTNINYANVSSEEKDIKPIVPDGGIPLAYITVAPGATSITDSDILDVRLFNRLVKGFIRNTVLFYDEGVEYVDWVLGYAGDGQAEFEKAKDHIRLYMRCPNKSAAISAVTDKPIDFTNLKKLHFEFGRDGYKDNIGSRIHFIVGTKNGDFNQGIQASITPPQFNRYLDSWNRGGVVTLDVTTVTGEHYIRVHANDATTSSISRWAEVKLWRVWGEL